MLMPPRHGKSEHGTQLFSSYWLAEKERQKLLVLTAAQRLSNIFGRNTRRIIQRQDWQKHYKKRLSGDTAAKANFTLSDDSDYVSVGRDGQVIGTGGDLILVDDLIKDRRDSKSPAIHEHVYYFYRMVIESRVEHEDTPIILINTRWGSNDLPGQLMKEEGEDWRIIEIPAIGVTREIWVGQKAIYIREPETALWPEKYGMKYLTRRRKRLGSEFEGMYQQNPQDMAGDLFRRGDWKYYEEKDFPEESEIKLRVLSIDTAFKEEEENDYTVIGSFVITYDERVFLRDIVRDRMRFSKLKKAVEIAIRSFKPHYVLIEDKGSGTSLIQEIEDDPELSKISVMEGLQKKYSKRDYAQSCAYLVELGVVHLPIDAVFVYPFLDETAAFPIVDNDDQVDMLTQFLIWARENHLIDTIDDDDTEGEDDTGIDAL